MTQHRNVGKEQSLKGEWSPETQGFVHFWAGAQYPEGRQENHSCHPTSNPTPGAPQEARQLPGPP